MKDETYIKLKNQFLYFKLTDKEIDLYIYSIIELTKQLGYNEKDLKLIGTGESSLCFELDKLVIKFTYISYYRETLTEYLSHSKKILQPQYEISIPTDHYAKPKLIVTKKLNTDNITEEDVIRTYIDLRNDGYLWYDTKVENLGRDEDDNIYLFDYGELVYLNYLNEREKSSAIKNHKYLKEELNEIYENGILSKVLTKTKRIK